MKTVRYSYLFLAYLLICNGLSGQPTRKNFVVGDHLMEVSEWDRADGLPHWNITSSLFDHQNIMWFATSEGLTRFNGTQFKTFTPKQLGIYPLNIYEDVNHNIWIWGTNEVSSQAIAKVFLPTSAECIPFSTYLNHPEKEELTISHCLKLKDALFFESKDGSFWKYDGQLKKVFKPPLAPKDRLVVLPALRNHFWITPGAYRANSNPLLLVDSLGSVIKNYGSPAGELSLYWLDEDYRLWFRPQNLPPEQVYEQTYFIDSLPGDPVPAVDRVDLWKNVFLAQPALTILTNEYGYGLAKNLFSGPITVYYEAEPLVPDLYNFLLKEAKIELNGYPGFLRDQNGDFWFHTAGSLLCIRLRSRPFATYLNNLSCRAISGFKDGSLFINTYGGIHRVNTDQSVERIPIKYDEGDNPMGICFQGNTMWVSQVNSVVIGYDLQKKTSAFHELPLELGLGYNGYAFWEPQSDSLWLGSKKGLLEIDQVQQKIKRVALPDTAVYCFQQAGGGLWMGTSNGILHWPSRRFYITKLADGNPISVYHLHQDPEGLLWMATNQGLIKWAPFSEQYQRYTTQDGLTNERLHAVYADKRGLLWLPSNHGLMRFDPATGYVRAFFTKHGLPSNEFNFLSHHQADDGQLFFGGINGLVAFYPEQINDQSAKQIPALELTKILQTEKETGDITTTPGANVLLPIAIPPTNNRIQFDLVCPIYEDLSLLYHWRIPGLFPKWQREKLPAIALNNLPYGAYNLEVFAFSQEDELVKTPVLTIPLRVIRPYYLRWWFITGAALLLIAVAYAMVRRYNSFLIARNVQLESEVAQRTLVLAEKNELIQEQVNELKQLDLAKSTFFANVSHELRTPLTLIIGHTKAMLTNPHLPGPLQHPLATIERNSTQIHAMTEELLELAKVDAGVLTLDLETLEWLPFARQLFASFQGKAYKDHQDYQLDISPDETKRYFIKADPKKCERVLINLINNALKFTPPNGKVTVSASFTDAQVQVRVSDDGPGIAPADLPNIFNRFYQASLSNKTQNPGFGIGLAICREYALLMGGNIRVESQLGQGSTFTFVFPKVEYDERSQLVTDNRTTPAIAAPTVNTAPNRPSTKTGQHILIVEDNPDLLAFLAQQLKPYYRIHLAANGVEALDLLNKQDAPIELILSDIMMPKMDGYSLLEQVRKHPRFGFMPFIFLSALSESTDKIKGYHLGIDSYITKPFVAEELTARVQNILRNQHKRRLFVKQHEAAEVDGDQTAGQAFSEIWLSEVELIVKKELPNNNFKVSDLAYQLNVSERTLRSRLMTYTGLSPAQYLMQIRLHQALVYLEQKRYKTVAEVCYAIGLKNSGHFSKSFKKVFGRLPSEYLKR